LTAPRVLPVGDAALTVELGHAIDAAVNSRVRALDRELVRAPFAGFREAVPTYRSLLVLYDPSAIRFAAARRLLIERAERATPSAEAGRVHEAPTVYGGEDGPDLAEVSRARGLAEGQVIALHAGRPYTAMMLGFTPGFAYLGLLDATLATPRRATPRVRVPAGSVGIAGRQTGIYPRASPGGWSLLGRTRLPLFDPGREPASLVQPGDRVLFVPVPELPVEEAPSSAPGMTVAEVEVVEGGVLTTVQGPRRTGHRRIGVSGAGPLDLRAHRAANRLVGNHEDAPALECTVSGPTLRFHHPVRLALTGADLGAVLQRADLGEWPVPMGAPVLARAGNVLRFAGPRAGCRASLAIAGGIDVPAVLGSPSTDLPGGFGGLSGRALRAGDVLGLGHCRRGDPREGEEWTAPSTSVSVRVVLGPQDDCFPPASVETFFTAVWRVGPTSDRVGLRLLGPGLAHRGQGEIVSDGMVPGCIQVPPDGQPIVMMADAPTTGGYPKIATVVSADLGHLAQLVPGVGTVRFEAVSIDDL
jgi:KipI family sensor histidine kinase inhibitor